MPRITKLSRCHFGQTAQSFVLRHCWQSGEPRETSRAVRRSYMADFRYRYPQNVPGKFYTDILHLDCYACRKIAPAIFRRDEVLNISYVFKQPATPEEFAQCHKCFDRCPCRVIGDQQDWVVAPLGALVEKHRP